MSRETSSAPISIAATDVDAGDVLTYTATAYNALTYLAYQQKQSLGLTGPFLNYYTGLALGQGENG